MDSKAPQPINSIATSTEAAYAGGKPEAHKKDRQTRPQKRSFANDKKGAKHGKKPKPANHRDSKPLPKDVNTVDDVIAYLLTLRGKGGNRNVQDSLSRVTKTLEGRITHDAPKPKKEPSAKKLEKIQKRREIRAEKRKAYLAEKAKQTGQVTEAPVADAPVAESQVTESQVIETKVVETKDAETQTATEAPSVQQAEYEEDFEDFNFDD